jgi:hypothetical protein
MAVGYQQKGENLGLPQPLAELWTGKWKIVPNPSVGSLDELLDISCSSDTYCVAVGFAGSESYAQVWNGTDWNVTPPYQQISGTSVTIESVSCVSKDCVGVGYTGDPFDNNSIRVAEFWNGTSWTIDSPTSSPSENELHEVSCTNNAQCLAVGEATPSGEQLIADAFANGIWSDVSPSNTILEPLGVDCVKTGDTCMAVGRHFSASVWNESAQTWTPTAPVVPANERDLLGVSCPSTSLCVAVGAAAHRSGSGSQLALGPVIEAWNGSSWALMDTQRVGTTAFTPQVEFDSVSCPSATFCMAVGEKNQLSPANDPRPDAAYWGTLP